MIPQASLVRAIGKSMLALSGDPREATPKEAGKRAERVTRAWEQLAFSRTTPLLQIPPNLVGTGFTEEGYFSANLPFEQRLKNIAPLPISGQSALEGQTSPTDIALNLAGVSSFPGEDVKDIEKEQKINFSNERLKPLGASVDGGVIKIAAWDEMERVAVKGIADTLGATHLGEFNTLTEFEAAYKERMAPLLVSETMSLPEAEAAIATVLGRLQAIKDVGTARKNFRLNFWREHPDLLTEAVEIGIEDTNADERKIIDAYRQSQQIQGGINGRMPAVVP